MVEYRKKILKNGLTVIVHEDRSTPLVAVNVLYKVGSKDEQTYKTGITHLFEHLMFGGSKHIADFDSMIQKAGGENNAFTNSDITNFYDVLPKENLEIALWMESDRMSNLKLSRRVLNTQKKVVIEEFKETCLNEPYGDLYHHLGPMAYQNHPYQWPTIGKEIAHIESVQMEDVKLFFRRHYRPDNAVLVLAGNVCYEEGFAVAEKWFGRIKKRESSPSSDTIFSIENPVSREKIIRAAVPLNSIVLAFGMAERIDYRFYLADILSDALASGRSSRFYRKLVKEKQLFSHIDAFVSGTKEPGLFIIEGKVAKGSDLHIAEKAIWEELEEIKRQPLKEEELKKLKNRAESALLYSEMGVLNKAMNLAFFEYLGDIDLINTEINLYERITTDELLAEANKILNKDNCCKLVYETDGTVLVYDNEEDGDGED